MNYLEVKEYLQTNTTSFLGSNNDKTSNFRIGRELRHSHSVIRDTIPTRLKPKGLEDSSKSKLLRGVDSVSFLG
jgi:hypothetical protein